MMRKEEDTQGIATLYSKSVCGVCGVFLCVWNFLSVAVSFHECQVFPCMKCFCVTLYSVAVGLVTTVEWYAGSLVCVV